MIPCDSSSQLNNEAVARNDGEGKCTADAGSFFDCRICLELAKDPVVTCCGHLFCWPCLFRWINIDSDAKECPMCKGLVTTKSVTPINGRGKNDEKPEAETNTSLNIPLRPEPRRIESWRQALRKAAFTLPMEEMIRRLGRKFDFSQVQNTGASQESSERNNAVLNRILTSRGMREERKNIVSPNGVADRVPSIPTSEETRESHINATFLPGLNSFQDDTILRFSSALSAAETDFPANPVDRNPQMPFTMDDIDEFLSISADMNPESQTQIAAMETDGRVYPSRALQSCTSDVDGQYSRSIRRRLG